MQKINFKNLPDTSTPLNASTLNQMQDNIENAIPTIVDSLSGSSTTDAPSVHAVNDKINSLTAYSTTTETVCGTYDGKPLYRKIINLGYLPNANYKDVSTGLTNVTIINIYGRATGGSSGNTLTIPYVGADASANIFTAYQFQTNNIRITTNSDRSAFVGYITLEYTKTTD